MKRISAFLLVLIALDASAQNITRKAVFRKGQQFEKVSINNSDMTLEMMGQKREVSNSFDVTWQITVADVVDTAYIIENTLTRRKLGMNAMGNEQNLDSDSAHHADNPMMGPALMDGIGKTSRVWVNKNGNIILSQDTVEQTEELTAAMGSASSLVNATKKPGHNYELVAPLPKKNLKVGDEWTDTANIDGNKGTVTYKVKSIDKDETTITHTGKTSNVIETNNNGMQMVIKTEGTVSGTHTFDTKTGIIKTSNNITEASGTMEMMGQAIPITIKSVNSTTVKAR
jgi:hypothetical protein